MPTITTGINGPSNYQLQTLPATDTISTLSKPSEPEKNSAYNLELTAEARSIQQEYASQETQLEQQHQTEKQQLEAEHQQERQQLENEFKLKEQSVGINIYT